MASNGATAIPPSTSSSSELDVEIHHNRRSGTEEGTATATMGPQVRDFSSVVAGAPTPAALTFAESESTSSNCDDMTDNSYQTADEGLDTLSSLDSHSQSNLNGNLNKSSSTVEGDSCNSGNYSACSSADLTVRTRLETMDSIPIDGNIDYGYDVDHRSGDSLAPPLSKASSSHKHRGSSKASLSSHKSDAFSDEQQRQHPHSYCCTRFSCARRIHKQWVAVTKKLRGVMLDGVVHTSVTAAKYPCITIALVTTLSIFLIAMGFYTNFNVRLDNDKVFTPTSSEVVEFSEYLGDMSMYEEVETDRRRKLQQARVLRKLREERKLITFHIFNASTTPSSSPSFAPAPIGEREDRNDGDREYKNDNNATTDSVSIEVVDLTEAPQEEIEGEEEGEEEEKYYERGKGIVFPLLVHANTENVFTIQGIHKMFDVLDFVRTNIPGYQEACLGDENSFHNVYGENTCEIRSITRFWNHNRTLFEEQVKTEEDLFEAADETFYPDGGYVDLPFVLAQYKDDEHGRPVEGQAFFSFIYFKHSTAYRSMTDNLLRLQEEWKGDHNHNFSVEFVSPDSFLQEVERAVMGDLPLIPAVFLIMCLFTCLVFFKCHRVYSRSLLGVGAVVTIFMSILSGYGILFTAGIPMTVMTNMLVFVVFGIGLDDTFIITGAYFRTDHREDPVERVRRTMEAVGSSILLTTITTSVAFMLGCTSTILPIRWLCLYAFPAIMIDFLYQITFFIAILVLDERRIQSNRMDCCICIRVPNGDEDGDTNDDGSAQELPGDIEPSIQEDHSEAFEERESTGRTRLKKKASKNVEYDAPSDHIADRFMRWFASRLMHPKVKIVVILVFTAFAALCAYRTTLLRQKFNFKDLLPTGSYAAEFATQVDYYSDRAIAIRVVFRFVEQEDEEVRNQMERYVEELVEKVDALNEPAPLFWAREFRTAVENEPDLQGLPFREQLDILLQNPAVNDAVGKDIRFRDDGTIMNSEVMLYITDLDTDNVRSQIEFLQQQREVARSQPVNQGKKLWSFFAYDVLFHIFSFYEVAAGELAVTTVASVLAVCMIAFVLIPHWSAVPIIFPLLSVLYIELLGVLEMFGYSINVVTYVVLVVSIGLLVDFIMHILLRYYESECDTREEKVKDALGTMGASILVGGLSTFLGVTPLIFSSSEILSTICLAFLAMVFLGVTHGLILLPVILSYCGTEKVVRHRKRLSLIRITTALSERFHQSMERRHSALENV